MNIKNVAENANVSISTVSRVLNDSGYVSAKTRKRVLDTVRELGYRQNTVAKSLRTRSSTIVGLVVPDISNEFYSALAKSVDRVLSVSGFQLLLCNTWEDEEREQVVIDSLIGNQVRGLIVVSAGTEDNEHLIRSGIPTVVFDRPNRSREVGNTVYVHCDNYESGREATEILLARGARRLAFLRTHHPVVPMDERERGFRDAVDAADDRALEARVYSVNISSSEAMTEVSSIYPTFQFDGLFCAADILALGALKALRDLSVHVPNDVQVIGFDGIPLGRYTEPPLSTMVQDVDLTGRVMAEELLGLMSTDTAATGKKIVLPTRFEERESTAPLLPSTDPSVATVQGTPQRHKSD